MPQDLSASAVCSTREGPNGCCFEIRRHIPSCPRAMHVISRHLLEAARRHPVTFTSFPVTHLHVKCVHPWLMFASRKASFRCPSLPTKTPTFHSRAIPPFVCCRPAPGAPAAAAAPSGKELSEEELKRKCVGLYEEFCSTLDVKEGLACIGELNTRDKSKVCVCVCASVYRGDCLGASTKGL